jgi:hypothetical protein
MTRLTDLLDRYGEAIAADLALAGWDVVELTEAGRWAFSLNLVDHLPRTSAYANAVAQDDELAEAALNAAPEGTRVRLGSRAVPMTEWSPEVEALSTVVDRLAEVINAVVVNHPSGKGKPTRANPYPRPVTAVDRARARRRRQAAADLEAQLFPDLH